MGIHTLKGKWGGKKVVGGMVLLAAGVLFGILPPVWADITVTVAGPGGLVTQNLPGAGGTFDVNLPLTKNAVNNITVTAKDASGNSVSAEVAVTQVSLDAIVVSQVTAERLSVEEVEQLVQDGVIDLENPENYNVSTFDIVLTIGKEQVPVSVPIVTPKGEPEQTGWETYQLPMGGGGGGRPPSPPVQIVVFEQQVEPSAPGAPAPPSIPGVIIIEGNIKCLKDHFKVRLLLMNTSGIFVLDDVTASLEFPDGGLSHVLPVDGIISFGNILPGEGAEPGQKEKEFIIRGDEIGIRGVKVNFGGIVTGPGIPEDSPIPFNGSATTEVEVKGPPTFEVVVTHPDEVQANVPYELKVDITNTGDVPAMYTSLELDVGGDAQIAECQLDSAGQVQCEYKEGPEIASFGHIMPGKQVSATFTVMPLVSGAISSCMGIADQNISLQVLVGNLGCMVGHFPPQRGVPEGIPTVGVAPAPKAFGIGTDSPVTAFFSERMSVGTITTGEGGTFNVYDDTGTLVPGEIRFVILNEGAALEKTVAVWQVHDNITNRLAPDTEYTVLLTQGIRDLEGNPLFAEWNSQFTTTNSGIQDTTPPTVSLSVKPPVNPNYVLPGQIIRINAYASDQGSRVARVEMRIKDLSEAGATYKLVDQRTVLEGDLPPFIFSVDSAKLTAGHTYQAMATAYDYMGNAQSATLSLVIAASADPPTVLLPADPAEPVLQGISVPLTPQVTGGVREVRYYLDGAGDPYKTVTLSPWNATLGTLSLALGQHTIRVLAEDALGQTGESTYTFHLAQNLNMPVVNFPGAVDGANYVVGATFIVSGRADDPVGIQSVHFYLDHPQGAPIASGMQPVLINTSTLGEGDHRIYILASNQLGITNDVNDPASYLEFTVLPLPSGPPPAAPSITQVSFPTSGRVTVMGTTVPGARVDITNTSLGITVPVPADSSGNFSGIIEGDTGHALSLIVYDFSQSQEPSAAATAVVPAAPVLTGIGATPEVLSFSAPDTYQQITVTGHYSDGSTGNLTSQAAFVSSDPAVATVNASGGVKGVSTGSAVITVSVAGLEDQVDVTANIVLLTSITADPSVVTLVSVGQTQQITVTGHYSDGSSEVLGSGVSFANGNTQVATVQSSGLVTALSDGTTAISVYYPGVDPVSVSVTVDTNLDPAPTIAILSPSTGTGVERGQILTISVRAGDAIGGVKRIYLQSGGETTHSELKQIAQPSPGEVTESFSLTVSQAAAIGGTITVEVWAEDTSGKTSEVVSIHLSVVDHTPPTVTIVEPAQQTPFNYGDMVTVRIGATDAVGVRQIRFETTGGLSETGSELVNPATSPAEATFSLFIPYHVPDPDVVIQAYATDEQGNEGMSVPVHIIVTDADITPPETVATAVTDPGTGTVTLVSYEVTSGLNDLDYVLLYFRRNGIGTFNRYTGADGSGHGKYTPDALGTGVLSFDSTRTGGDGDYEFYTVGVDKAGNFEAAPDNGSGGVLADQTVTFTAGTQWTVITSPTVIGEGDTTYDDQNLRIAGTTVTLNGSHSFHNVELLQGAVLTHPETDLAVEYGIDLEAWTISVDAQSAVNVEGRGYLGGNRGGNDASGQTLGNVDGSSYRSGGSYGGLGGTFDGPGPNALYGTLTDPVDLGSGGSGGNYSTAGGDGGGLVLIRALHILSDGLITANGAIGGGNQAGSGSGGTINIETSTLSGTGTIQANGGAREVGGGGGRIAIQFTDMTTMNPGLIQALGGQGGNVKGGNGTVFLKDRQETSGTLVVDGQGTSSAYSTLPIPAGYIFDHIIIRNNARVVADDPLEVRGTLAIRNGSILTHSLGSEAGLSIQAGRIEIDETSSIDVTARGYRGGLRDGNGNSAGITLGGLAGAQYRSGGSYGGYGGVHDGPGSNAPYGHPAEPLYLGSGGSCGAYSVPGGNGGGRVTITATEAVVVDGSILANGGTGGGNQAGSGSGGSIRIETSLLGGAGSIAANGGAYEVGGGGGRIAVTYEYLGEPGDDLDGLRNIQAFGGHGGNAWGSAGTVLMKRSGQVYGDLYIDDNMNNATSSVYTPLTPVGFGEVMDLTADTLTTDGGVRMVPNGLVGLEINPDITQNQTFRIVSNTESAISVDISGGTVLTDVAQTGDTYMGIYRFDNVVFRRGGYLVLGDRLVVAGTLRIEEYGRVTHYDATMDFESLLDLVVGELVISDTGSINVEGRGYLGGNRGGNDASGQTLGNVDGATYRSGGSYGGLGGSFGGQPNGVYGSLADPVDLGSGGSGGNYSTSGGDGGGRVFIQAGGMTIDGLITANGAIGGGNQAGSGSGGTINIETSTLSGTGTIQANGGAREVGGGGGRIAVRCTNPLGLPLENVRALGGDGGNADGQAGTVHIE